MKIVDKFEIKNRGTVAIVTEIGEQKIFLNDFLKQNDQQWQIAPPIVTGKQIGRAHV